MPELPEVETTCRGLSPLLRGRTVRQVNVRDARLRQPVPADLPTRLTGQRLESLTRRAKYLLFNFANGTLIVHLGMSGSLRVVASAEPYQRHDHVDIGFGEDSCLRLRDPRRFGLMVWCEDDPAAHPLLRHLGPEPFAGQFDGPYLATRAQGRRGAVKNFIMDGRIVVGVGNIYASEALFRAGIHPARAAGRVSERRYSKLVGEIRCVLEDAINAGGTTLRDFVRNDGQPGYFRHNLQVYGRAAQPCYSCGTAISVRTLGQRSSFFCRACQR